MNPSHAFSCSADRKSVFDRYHAAWESHDHDRIAELHTSDTVFAMHDGSPVVCGREALRTYCKAMFQRFSFTLQPSRLLHGPDHWTFEWTMELNLESLEGPAFKAKIEMLDVVQLTPTGLVVRKDVFINGAQASAAFAKAGLDPTGEPKA